jgi:hypothetical protein
MRIQVMTMRKRSVKSYGSDPERSSKTCTPDGTEMDEETMFVLIVDDETLSQTTLAYPRFASISRLRELWCRSL